MFTFLLSSLIFSLISADNNKPTLESCLQNRIKITKDSFIAALHYFKTCQELAATLNGYEKEQYLKELYNRLKESKEEFLHHIVGTAEDVRNMAQAFNELSVQFVKLQEQGKETYFKSNSENRNDGIDHENNTTNKTHSDLKCYDEDTKYEEKKANKYMELYYGFISLVIFLIFIFVVIITFVLCKLFKVLCNRMIYISEPDSKKRINQNYNDPGYRSEGYTDYSPNQRPSRSSILMVKESSVKNITSVQRTSVSLPDTNAVHRK